MSQNYCDLTKQHQAKVDSLDLKSDESPSTCGKRVEKIVLNSQEYCDLKSQYSAIIFGKVSRHYMRCMSDSL